MRALLSVLFGGSAPQPEPPATLGEYMAYTTQAVNAELTLPPAAWIDSYNRQQARARAEAAQAASPVGAVAAPARGATLTFPPTPLVFGPTQPSVFYEDEGGVPYRGQAMAKERIDTRIGAMRTGERVKFFFVGTAGSGKTALAWVVALRIQVRQVLLGMEAGRFFEVLPGQIENKAQLDVFMARLQPNDIVFVDEVHKLKDAVGAEPLYHVLADTGTARYPLGEGAGWLEMPAGVCWLTATTEPGKLDGTTGGALRRRLGVEIRLEAPSTDDLAAILRDQDVAVHVDAATAMAERSGGLPWQALAIYDEARGVALCAGADEITDAHAERAFTVMGIDERGLGPQDRKVIEVLLGARAVRASGKVVYQMKEAALRSAAGIDEATYTDQVLPKLSSLGYLSTSGGQTLTDKALTDYGYLARTVAPEGEAGAGQSE